MPVITSAKPAQNSTSTLEISTLQKDLASHQSTASQKLTPTLTERIKQILPKFARDLPKDSLDQISAEIAQESSQDILANIGKINNFEEANTIVADSLTQSIVAHPQLEGRTKTNEGKIFENLLKQTDDIVQAHQQDLQKAAVLGSIVAIARIQKPDEQLRSQVTEAVDQAVAARMPLAQPEINKTLYGNASGFLQSYLGHFNKDIGPQIASGKIPDFKTYQDIKSKAFSGASGEFAKNVKFKGRIEPTDITNRIGFILGLDSSQVQFSSVGQAKGVNAFMMRMMLSSNKGQEELDNALLSHDRSWLERQFATLRGQVERFKKQRNLRYKDRKAYLLAQKNLASLGNAMTFRARNDRRAKNWMQLVQTIPAPSGGHNLTLAYQAAITTREAALGNLPGVYAPRSLVGNPIFMARNTLSLLSPKLGLGDLFGSIKESFMAPSLAMGKSFASAGVLRAGFVGASGNLMRRLGLALAGLWGGMLLYLMFLGKAALTGFLIGTAAGGVAGAAIPVAFLGPAGVFLWPVTIPLGMVVGGFAGALIGYGLASGSTTAVSMGVGAGVGGTVGAVTGGVIGGALFGAVPIIGPFIAPLGVVLGATIGALVGAALGAAIGYVIGHYVIGTIGVPASGALAGATIGFYLGGPPGALIGAGIGWLLAGGWSQVKDFLTGAGNVGAGAATGVAGFATGLASTVWGGITAGVGIAFGGLSSAVGFLVGGLGSLSIPTFAIAVPVFGGIGAITIGSLIVGITTATSFFSTDKEISASGIGDNAYFTVKKTAAPTELENSDVTNPPGATITFHITLKAKVNLTDIQVTDNLRVDGKDSDGISNFTIENDNSSPPKPISPPCGGVTDSKLDQGQTWTCDFSIVALNDASHDFTDAVMTNTVTVSAKSGTDSITDSASAYVFIGEPDLGCFTFNGPWAQNERAAYNLAITALSQSQVYISKLCSYGTITLNRVIIDDWNSAGCDSINITNWGFGNPTRVLAHESGHVLQCNGHGSYNLFINQQPYDPPEGFICTYELGKGESEDFAEMIGLYVAWHTYSNACLNDIYPNQYPLHYDFAKQNLFPDHEY